MFYLLKFIFVIEKGRLSAGTAAHTEEKYKWRKF